MEIVSTNTISGQFRSCCDINALPLPYTIQPDGLVIGANGKCFGVEQFSDKVMTHQEIMAELEK
jgi:hypothetical protein